MKTSFRSLLTIVGKPWFPLSLIIALLVLISLGGVQGLAQEPSLHPTFPLLDEFNQNVLETGKPVSTINTCGACHDTGYIAEHSGHSLAGLNEFGAPGVDEGLRPWELSSGTFGGWDPLTYRYLTPTGDTLFDLGTPEWVQAFGARHVGGGPAYYAPSGDRLAAVPDAPNNPSTRLLNPQTGQTEAFDWLANGGVELNCFLCHTSKINNDARIATLGAGNFKWANSATLLGSGMITGTLDALTWNEAAFSAEGELLPEFVDVQDPENESCGLCHGTVHTNNDIPLTLNACDLEDWNTATTGQVMSPQRLFRSGLNLADKNNLSRAWDIHTERVVDCVDCHHALNNPVYFQGSTDGSLEHLIFDARRIDIEDFLYRPSHQLARSPGARDAVSADFADAQQPCESCHDATVVHDWLPYKIQHFDALSCESCHVPRLYAPALSQVDWTAVTAAADPLDECRGLQGEPQDMAALITGYEPLLVVDAGPTGNERLAPYNLLGAWYWIHGEPLRPVRRLDLEAAYFAGDRYRPDVLTVFDADRNGTLSESELRLDTPAKVTVIESNLAALGLTDPRIQGEVVPYPINHNVTNGEWALRDCRACHSRDSRLAQAITVTSYLPGGVMPSFVSTADLGDRGAFVTTPDGALQFQPRPSQEGLYIFGYSSVWWIDWLGIAAFFGAFLGVLGHGGLRIVMSLRQPSHEPQLRRVYMYTIYERLWHWLQAAAIFALIFTGLIIHRPDTFGIFSFTYAVQVHNVLGWILFANAALAAFYHLASGEIKQYIPQPRGFFDQAITQAIFYLRGIFKGEPHPFEKNVRKKLNPLQQLTYFGILNVLLPLQVITGLLMWGVQEWPALSGFLGGLPVLAPFHTLVAWLFAAFIVAHIYLTTTGHMPLAGIKAMIDGWDEVEVAETPTAPTPQSETTPEQE